MKKKVNNLAVHLTEYIVCLFDVILFDISVPRELHWRHLLLHERATWYHI